MGWKYICVGVRGEESRVLSSKRLVGVRQQVVYSSTSSEKILASFQRLFKKTRMSLSGAIRLAVNFSPTRHYLRLAGSV